MLAPFPIALSVVCAFTTAQAGHAGVLALLRGIVPGLDGFALFCFLVAILINSVGAAAAFGLATAAAMTFAIILAVWKPARTAYRGERHDVDRDGGRATFPAGAAPIRVELMTVRRLRTSWPAIRLRVSRLPSSPPDVTPLHPGALLLPSWYHPRHRRLRRPQPRRRSSLTPWMREANDDADNPIDHVIAISIDGLNPDAIKQLGKSPHSSASTG